MTTIFLATILNILIQDTQIDVGHRVYVDNVQVAETNTKSAEIDVDLSKLRKLEVSAFNATNESDRIAVSVGKLAAPTTLTVTVAK